MRKFTIKSLLAMMFCFGATNLSVGQAADNAVKINIMGAIISQYQIAYERALSENFAVQLSAGYITREWSILDTDGEEDIDQTGFILIPEARYYFGEALKGAYASAFFRYRPVSWVVNDLNTTDGFDNSGSAPRSAIGGGLLFGYQALINDAMVFDIFIGPQFKSVTQNSFTYDDPAAADPSYTFDDSKAESSGTGVRFGFNLGIAF